MFFTLANFGSRFSFERRFHKTTPPLSQLKIRRTRKRNEQRKPQPSMCISYSYFSGKRVTSRCSFSHRTSVSTTPRLWVFSLPAWDCTLVRNELHFDPPHRRKFFFAAGIFPRQLPVFIITREPRSHETRTPVSLPPSCSLSFVPALKRVICNAAGKFVEKPEPTTAFKPLSRACFSKTTTAAIFSFSVFFPFPPFLPSLFSFSFPFLS